MKSDNIAPISIRRRSRRRYDFSDYEKLAADKKNKIYLIVRLEENLIVLRKCHQENDGSYVFKAMNPLPPLRTLTTNVDHSTKIYLGKTNKSIF